MNKDIINKGIYIISFLLIASLFLTPLFFIVKPAPSKESVVVQIVGEYWTGSGFILKDGIIITAAHVLDGIENGQARFSDGTIICLDPNTYMIDGVWDVAIAKISGYNGPYANLGCISSIIIGANIELVGYPLGEPLWHSFGNIARLSKAGEVSLDIDGIPGDSGGPCFLGDKVIGILISGYSYTQMCFATDVSVIKNMLERYEILHGSY